MTCSAHSLHRRTVRAQRRSLLSMLFLNMKHDATDRFMRDSIGGCYSTERFFLLHHTLHYGRPQSSGNTVVRMFWSWSSVLEKRRVASCPVVHPQPADAAPFDTVSQTGQGRGRKLVTENSTPVGSGRFLSSRSPASPTRWSRIQPFDHHSPLVCLSPDASRLCPSIAELTLSVPHASQPPKLTACEQWLLRHPCTGYTDSPFQKHALVMTNC